METVLFIAVLFFAFIAQIYLWIRLEKSALRLYKKSETTSSTVKEEDFEYHNEIQTIIREKVTKNENNESLSDEEIWELMKNNGWIVCTEEYSEFLSYCDEDVKYKGINVLPLFEKTIVIFYSPNKLK
jgi:hypothetical protein